jgi:O-antigen/teichoic acid export membrane protein
LFVLLGLLAYGLRPWLFPFVDPQTVSGELLLWFAITTLGIVLKQIVYGGLQGLRRITAQVPIELFSLLAALVWMFLARDDLSLTLLFRILGTVHIGSLGIGLPVFLWMVARTGVKGGGQGEARTTVSGTAYRDYFLGAVGISLVALAFTDADRYVVAQVLPLEFIALFHIGARITRSANRLLAASNTAIQPEVTRLHAEGRATDADTLARIFLKFNVAVGVLVAFAIGVFARDLIIIVSSVSYTPAVSLVIILAACIPLVTATAPLTTVMKATDQVGGALRVDLAWALVYVALIAVLGPVFELNGIGFASLAACIVQLALAVRLSTLSIGIRFVSSVVIRMLIGVSLAMVPLIVVTALIDTSSGGLFLVLRVVLFAIGCAVYPRLLKTLRVFDVQEKERLSTVLQVRGLNGLARILWR